MLSISTEATIKKAENYLASLNASHGSDMQILSLASNFKHHHCGGIAAIAQAVITWARRNQGPTCYLRPYAQSVTDMVQLEGLVSTLPGLVGVLMARDIKATDGQTSLRRVVYELARKRVEEMFEGNLAKTSRGPSVSLVCADETSKWALHPLYHPLPNGGAKLRGQADFVSLARSITQNTVNERRIKEFKDDDHSAIGVMLKEVFSNTHRHARSDGNDIPYRKSVRGLVTMHHTISKEEVEQIGGGYEPLAQYLHECLSMPRRGKTLQFFELSIFDSGPGFAARRLGTSAYNISAEAEYQVVGDCFLKHVSDTSEAGSGVGLVRTLGRLKQRRGFLRIRTGGLSLFKQFSSGSDSVSPLTPFDFKLLDATTGNYQITAYPQAEGCVMTMLLPIGGLAQ